MNELGREVTVEEIVEEIVEAVNKVMRTMTTPSDSISEGKIGCLKALGPVKASEDVKEVGVAIGPAYGLHIHKTIIGLDHMTVLKEILAGIEEEGMIPRVIRGTRTSDVAFIANDVAKLVGSGIAVGIQSKGTTVIHQKDLYPLTNLELFPQAPIITLDMYRQIGKNAAKYAKGEQVKPVKVINDITSRPKYQVKAALMHTKETEYVVKRGPYIEIEVPV